MLPDSPAVNWTFVWSGPNGFSSDVADPVIPEADSTDSGTYILTVTGPTGCTATGQAEVVISTFNAPIITAADDTLCAGVSIELLATPYSGDVTYNWYLAGGDSLLATTTSPVLALSGFAPGKYGFYALATQDTCSTDPGPVTYVKTNTSTNSKARKNASRFARYVKSVRSAGNTSISKKLIAPHAFLAMNVKKPISDMQT